MSTRIAQLFLLLIVPFLGMSQNNVCFSVSPNPNPSDPALSPFTKYINVFGIGIYAESSISDAKVKHVAAIFAEWLDNNEDGVVDDNNVWTALTSRNALMPIFSQEGSAAENTFFNNYMGNGVGAVCYNGEIVTTRPLTAQFDATVEEVLHTISSVGYSNAYPSAFGEAANSNSLLTQAMDVARGGHFTTIPNPYPASAWYTYDDATCNYNCMSTEYFYWGLTSKLGIQNYGNRCMEISNEWKACTPTQFQTMDSLLYNLFHNPAGYVIPTVAPDGNYCPATTAYLSISNNHPTINVFPNPAQQQISFVLGSGTYILKTMAADGRICEQKQVSVSHQYDMDIALLPRGVYFLEIMNTDTNDTYFGKFLKQ